MIKRLMLVGEAPGREPIPEDQRGLTLTGDSGRRLCEIAGWEWLTYLRRTERHNIFYTPQYAWSRWKAEDRTEELIPLFEGRRVVLLGAKVAEAFRLQSLDDYEWVQNPFNLHSAAVARVPHPSGRNRVWNRRDERDRAYAFLNGLLDPDNA